MTVFLGSSLKTNSTVDSYMTVTDLVWSSGTVAISQALLTRWLYVDNFELRICNMKTNCPADTGGFPLYVNLESAVRNPARREPGSGHIESIAAVYFFKKSSPGEALEGIV